MNLAIDIGNTRAKLTPIDRGQAIDSFQIDLEAFDIPCLETLLAAYPAIDAAIAVSSSGPHERIETWLAERMRRFIRFDSSVPVPIANRYATPETLGADRLAAAVGAATLYPSRDVLIVDFGTAITFDLVSAKGEFLGGNISPGATTRFRALHRFTRSLPLCSLDEEIPAGRLGDSSRSAIVNGVVNGIVYEVEGYIRDLEKKYDGLLTIFTGGESNFFAERLKNTIFATYDLVAYGLNRILEYNAK